MKTNTTISFIASAILLVCSTAPVYASTPWLHTEGNKIKDPCGNTVILRGVDLIDLGFLEYWHGGAIAMIDRLTDKTDTQGNSPGWYPKVVRINITPPDAVGWGWPVPFDTTDCSFYYDLLRPVVDYCKSKDIYAIIDWHYVANTYDHRDTTSQFWEYIAPRFANDSHVLFELFNEPINDFSGDWIFNSNDTVDWLTVRQDMQTWTNIVRTYAPKNLILVAGLNYAQVLKPIIDYPVDGNNIVYVVHIYPGHYFNWWWSNSYEYFSRSHQDEIISCSAVYPVMMTEWGFSQSYSQSNGDTALDGTISNYGQPLMDFIEGLGISNSAWVASYNWGPPMFFNPDPENWSNPTGQWPLRVGEGEMGGFVKDTLYAKRNANQPCGGKIDLSSTSFNFGEIELGQSKVLTANISNTGCNPLIITSAGIKTDFALVSLLPSSTTIQPGETLPMSMTYSPTVFGNNSAVLQINSSDVDNPTIEIPLIAKGILPSLTPSLRIANILALFDKYVKDGSLQWVSKNSSRPDYHLNILKNLIQSAKSSIDRGKYTTACGQLTKIQKYFDSTNTSPGHVEGTGAVNLANEINKLMQALGCK